jgi:CubicO group peptidase (beta-lactamase class C family)
LSFFFGGVAGHSGLFSTADDMNRFMRIFLCKGKLPNDPTRVISEALVNQFTTRITGLSYPNNRAYGFDTVCPGTKMTNCFGHDGSTGVMNWVDKDKKIAFTVVTNRGHPDVSNGLFDSYKARIADTILEALGY